MEFLTKFWSKFLKSVGYHDVSHYYLSEVIVNAVAQLVER